MNSTSFELINFIRRITEGSRLKMLGASVISGASRGMILATINTTAANTFAQDDNTLYILYFLLFTAVYIASCYYVRVNSVAIVEKAKKKLTLELTGKMILAELGFLERFTKSEIFQRVRMDVNNICGIANTMLESMQSAILLVFCLIYIAWLVPIALFFAIIAISCGVAIYLRQNKYIKVNVIEAREAEVEFADMLRGLISGFKELKVNYAKRTGFQNDIVVISERAKKAKIKVAQLQTISFLTTQLFIFTLIAIVIFVLPSMMSIDETVIFQFFAAILFLIGPIENLLSAYQKIEQANISYEQVSEFSKALKDNVTEMDVYVPSGEKLDFQKITLDEICFEYSSHSSDDSFTIGPINLNINKGEILFIVGGNGTGKTTLLKLITGLYTPTSGTILINDNRLTLENQQQYRELFTTIFDDFYLFRTLYGLDNVDHDSIKHMMKRLEIDSKTSLNGREFTTIELSWGQKKRLAYLITYLDNRDIYVFDEFAADQDPVFKMYFYYTILPELKKSGKTVIAVTHDDNYFGACDRLVKMEDGHFIDIDASSHTGNLEKIIHN